MARTRDESLHEKRREQILLAAARVFKAKGFHGARTEDICAEAGLSAGTVFRHFPDKRAMIAAISEAEYEHYQAEIRRLATKESLQGMAHITQAELAELISPTDFDLGVDTWLELSRDPESKQRMLAFDAKLRTLLAKELARGQTEGWVRASLDPRGAATVILAVFSGLSFDQAVGVPTQRSTASALADLFGTYILAS